jgi:hypothetical protein
MVCPSTLAQSYSERINQRWKKAREKPDLPPKHPGPKVIYRLRLAKPEIVIAPTEEALDRARIRHLCIAVANGRGKESDEAGGRHVLPERG